MNEPYHGPLPPDVAEALTVERTRPAVDAATRARLQARLHASLLAGPSGGGAGAPAAAERAPGGTAALRGPWKALRGVHPGVTAAVGFAVGLTTGVAAHAWLSTNTPPTYGVPSAAPALPAIHEPPSAPAPARPSSPSNDEAAPAARGEAHAPPSVPSASSLVAERALLDIAHGALAKGDALSALDALGRHARQYPHGVYREEREALTIQSLRALGRTAEATRRAAAFETHYPNSLFRSTVDPTLDDNR